MIKLPHAIEIENKVIGICLTFPETVPKIIESLSPFDAFFDFSNKIVFGIISSVFNREGFKGVDLTTIQNELDRKEVKDTEKVNPMHLMECMSVVTSSAPIDNYLSIIKSKASLREIMSASHKSISDIENGKGVKEIYSAIEASLENIRSISMSKKNHADMKKHIKEMVSVLEKEMSGSFDKLNFGFYALENARVNMDKTDYMVIGARPSVGKTTLAINLATNISRQKKTAFLSYEMPAYQIIKKIAAHQLGFIPNEYTMAVKINHDAFQNCLTKILEERRLFVSDLVEDNRLSDCIAEIRRLKEAEGVEVFFIDYIQLIRYDGGRKTFSRENEVAFTSFALRSLAKSLNVRIIVLAQLNRDGDQMPTLTNLRESGALEQDATHVLLLHRNIIMTEEEIDLKYQSAILKVAKYRGGQTGALNIGFDLNNACFCDKRADLSAGYDAKQGV